MKAIIGTVIVIGSLLGGYLPHGSIGILIQPLEVLIIMGATIGAWVIATPGWAIKKGVSGALGLMKPSPFDKEAFQQLLGLMFKIFNKARREGLMSIEADVDAPAESPLFTKYPSILAEHHVTEFMCDYLRLMVGGNLNPIEIENLMDIEIETHHHEGEVPVNAVRNLADAFPALGIVACVMGVVHTMESVGIPPAELGKLIAAALVGTFLGILLSYGFVGPLATNLEHKLNDQTRMLNTIKVTLLASLNGYAPPVAVEFGRKALQSTDRPTFLELEEHVKNAKNR